MTEGFHNKPFSPKNFFLRDKVFAGYVDQCVMFEVGPELGRKLRAVEKAMVKAHKRPLIVN